MEVGGGGGAAASAAQQSASERIDPFFLAYSRMRRRRYDSTMELCDELLQRNPRDKAAWALKALAMTRKTYVDDLEIEDEGIADALLDENATAQLPRPGTSFTRPKTGAAPTTSSGRRPMSTAGGRPVSGYARPGTTARPTTGSVSDAYATGRPGTARPVTSAGRLVRLATAALATTRSGPLINVDQLNPQHLVKDMAMAKLVCNYLLYHEHNPRKALELAAEATAASSFKDWWWKMRVGQCHYQLGLFRDAEHQFQSALRDYSHVDLFLHLAKVFTRADQPNAALDILARGLDQHPGDASVMVAMARVHAALNNTAEANNTYKLVLRLDPSNIEALSCLAAEHFYADHPELAMRLYRRLLQMGVTSAELWNNFGLCCFHAAQYDMALACMERALALAESESKADVWYNIGHVAVGIGDVVLAYQAFKLAVSNDPNHAEAYTNIGVLELRQGNVDRARAMFTTAMSLNEFLPEPFFNNGLLAFKLGDFQEAFKSVSKALEIDPQYSDALELQHELSELFAQL